MFACTPAVKEHQPTPVARIVTLCIDGGQSFALALEYLTNPFEGENHVRSLF